MPCVPKAGCWARPGSGTHYHSTPRYPCEAVREKTPVVVRRKEELTRRFPALAHRQLQDRSVACVALSVGNRRLGAIALTFPLHRDLTESDEINFLSSLADACAQALDRANALTEARETADKLAFWQTPRLSSRRAWTSVRR
ncbi:MAG: GAF domain-containing protein [Nocardioidaceae bacterium]